MKDGRCNVHFKDVRCGRAYRHKGDHTFTVHLTEVRKTPKQVRAWAIANKACTTPHKLAYTDHTAAALASLRIELEKGVNLRSYECTCGKHHIREVWTDAAKHHREARDG